MPRRSFCTGSLDHTIERLIITEMTDDRLIWQYHYNVKLIREYAESLSNINMNFLSYQAYYQPLWIRTAAIEIKFIIDELQFRMERHFTPYLDKTIQEILGSYVGGENGK